MLCTPHKTSILTLEFSQCCVGAEMGMVEGQEAAMAQLAQQQAALQAAVLQQAHQAAMDAQQQVGGRQAAIICLCTSEIVQGSSDVAPD